MSIYTKTGDKGSTTLVKSQNISKSDDRIQLLGNLDELTSNIGLVKASESREDVKTQLERIQKNLMTVMAGVADPYNNTYKIPDTEVTYLEVEIDRLENTFPRKKEFIIPGSNRCSARLDVIRTITRRAERWLSVVERKFSADSGSQKYMNRLADYLYMLARYTDYLYENQINKNDFVNHNVNTIADKTNALANKTSSIIDRMPTHDTIINNIDERVDRNGENSGLKIDEGKKMDDAIIQAVLKKLGVGMNKIDLETAKKLIARVEQHSAEAGLNAVIAVCGPEGNPIAVHVMDGAFLASFDIAMKKAYTSVAVKMSTKKLGELSQPGQTFYGIDKADNGRIITFGGGVPLLVEDKIVGGLGVSGGTSEEDDSLAEFGQSILSKLWYNGGN